MLNKDLFYKTIAPFEVDIDAAAFDRLDKFAELLVEINKSFNLTAITEPDDVTVKHFADCLAILKYAQIPENAKIIDVGTGYLRIEGAFYAAIGFLFLFYGLYRAVGKPGMSFILTIISLGTRVLLSYTVSSIPSIGVYGIWWSVPIGWILADTVGALYYFRKKSHLILEKATNT